MTFEKQSNIGLILLTIHALKKAKSWATFVHNFNESSWYSTKDISVLNIQFEQNFISFCIVYD
jgi:hypothetical protein